MMNAVLRAIKGITLERGKKAEENFFKAMMTSASAEMPKWFVRVRRPTLKEDRHEGKDAIIVTSDVGELFIQIKSSETGANHFRQGRHFLKNKFIAIVVIREQDTLEDIRANARHAFSQLRQDILKSRNITER